MITSQSSQVKANFDKKAQLYDANALVQKTMAETLATKIKDVKNKYDNIFEIGCGTGNLTNILTTFCPRYVVLNDISQAMIEENKKRIDFFDYMPTYINDDFMLSQCEKKFDLICSNATIQWIQNIDELFDKVKSMLNSSGVFAFTTFITDTFWELDQAFQAAYDKNNLPYKKHTLNFVSLSNLKSSLISNGFNIISSQENDYIYYFNSPNDFLKSIHSIGAAGNVAERVSVKLLKNMMAEYKAKFQLNNKIHATYKVAYVLCNLEK